MIHLCTVGDVEERLGRPLTAEESAKASAAIADVSAWLRSLAPGIPPLPPPGVIGLAARKSGQIIISDPESALITSEGLGGYTVSMRPQELTLADSEWAILRPYTVSRIGTVQIDPITAVVG